VLATDAGSGPFEHAIDEHAPESHREWVSWRPDRPSVAPQRSRQPRCSAIEPGTAV
jgi:hypothetical protein